MDARILHATGNDPSLAENIVHAFASMLVSFLACSVEETCNGTSQSDTRENHTNAPEEEGCGVHSSVDNAAGTAESGEYTETVCPSGKSIFVRMAERIYRYHRRRSGHFRIGSGCPSGFSAPDVNDSSGRSRRCIWP